MTSHESAHVNESTTQQDVGTLDRRELIARAVALGLGAGAAATGATHAQRDATPVVLGEPTLVHEGTKGGAELVERALKNSRSARMIHDELVGRGLTLQPERAQVYRATVPGAEGSSVLSIVPLVTKELTMEASISLSEEEFAVGVLVHMRDVVIMETVETFAVMDGRLSIDKFNVDELMDAGAGVIARGSTQITSETPLLEITPRQTHMIATTTFENLLVDEASRAVHSPEEIEALGRNMPVVSELGSLILMQSAVAACCSTSCFGCTSCSSFTINTIKAK